MYWIYCLFALAGGALLPIQAGINGRLRASLENPWSTTMVSVTVSLVTVLILSVVTRAQIPSMSTLTQVPWWAWTGGVVGAVYVCVALVCAPKLGATALVTALIGGQMLASIALDQFGVAGFAQHSLNFGRIVGLGLLLTGVVLIQRF
jgi:transporter family-2 protein